MTELLATTKVGHSDITNLYLSMSLDDLSWTRDGVVAKVTPVVGAPVGDPIPEPTGAEVITIHAKKALLTVNPLQLEMMAQWPWPVQKLLFDVEQVLSHFKTKHHSVLLPCKSLQPFLCSYFCTVLMATVPSCADRDCQDLFEVHNRVVGRHHARDGTKCYYTATAAGLGVRTECAHDLRRLKQRSILEAVSCGSCKADANVDGFSRASRSDPRVV